MTQISENTCGDDGLGMVSAAAPPLLSTIKLLRMEVMHRIWYNDRHPGGVL